MSTDRVNSLVLEIQRLRTLHQDIGAQLRHVEYLQSIANPELRANAQIPQPSQQEHSSSRHPSEMYSATLYGTPAMGMKWAANLGVMETQAEAAADSIAQATDER